MRKIILPILLISTAISCNKKDSEITPSQENEKGLKVDQLKETGESAIEKAKKVLEKAILTSKLVTQKEVATQEQLNNANEAIKNAKKEASKATNSVAKKAADDKVKAAEKKKEEAIKAIDKLKEVILKAEEAIKAAEKALETVKQSEETKSKIAAEKDESKVKELKKELEKETEIADKAKLEAEKSTDDVTKEINIEFSDIKKVSEEALKKYEVEMKASLARVKVLSTTIKGHTDIIEQENKKTLNYQTLKDVQAFKRSVETAKQNATNLSTYLNEMVVLKDKMHNEAFNHSMYGTEQQIIARTEELRNNLEAIKKEVKDADYYIRLAKGQVSSMENQFSTFESDLNTQKNRKLINLQYDLDAARINLKNAEKALIHQYVQIKKWEFKIINHSTNIKQFEERIKIEEDLLKNLPSNVDEKVVKNNIKELKSKIDSENLTYNENSIRSNISIEKGKIDSLKKNIEDAKQLVAVRERELQQAK
ncbi:hypothetical protein EI427_17540 [Flammeovirga pectinis]|uniref:Lipoprotein n=1 Tax=Flammeovirga pectinis TaxID=2494373 RepID=A0A3S9P6X7_9BACT|nr:hypothetical protein [Flammeovirga pectinis]AZQ63960.1 hypothetical protein EI427_17540 [Flammeovirga pectinis]